MDMVIVLDRSGSMKGRKIEDARRAVLELLSSLSAGDRFALITYSDGVHIASGLSNVTAANRVRITSAVNKIRAGGGTNLGAGLRAGMDTLAFRSRLTNSAKVILISDGLANKAHRDQDGAMADLAEEGLALVEKYVSKSSRPQDRLDEIVGLIALTRREIARSARVPVIENKAIARALYQQVEVGKTIPESLYQAVAEILGANGGMVRICEELGFTISLDDDGETEFDPVDRERSAMDRS